MPFCNCFLRVNYTVSIKLMSGASPSRILSFHTLVHKLVLYCVQGILLFHTLVHKLLLYCVQGVNLCSSMWPLGESNCLFSWPMSAVFMIDKIDHCRTKVNSFADNIWYSEQKNWHDFQGHFPGNCLKKTTIWHQESHQK